MTAQEFKKIISDRTGIPINLLNGETEEEDIIQAKALIAYKEKAEAERIKTPREQFAEWFNQQTGEGSKTDISSTITELESMLYYSRGGYPVVKDGPPAHLPISAGNVKEDFETFMAEQLAFNPFRDGSGWIKI